MAKNHYVEEYGISLVAETSGLSDICRHALVKNGPDRLRRTALD